jgi:hypothetical protein
MQDQWYYLCGGKQAGPVSTDGLRQMVGAGQLGDADEVWRVGTPDWLPVRRVPEFAELIGHRLAAVVQVPAAPSPVDLARVVGWLSAGPDVVLRHGKLSAVGAMVGFAVMPAVGVGLLSRFRPEILIPFLIALGLAGVGLLGILLNFAVLLDRRPQLVLGREGLRGTRGRVRRAVRWAEIEKANLSQLLRNGAVTDAVITLTVRDTFGTAEQVAVDVYRLTWDPERIFREISRRAGLAERVP